MIIFDKLWETMKTKRISTYRLREDVLMGSREIKRLKNNESVETKTLNRICAALNCKLEDIAEYIKDE